MSSLTIHHVTTYRYQRPVGFGEHRMMLRPRDTGDQKVLGATLEITPKPVSLDFVQDSFGNHVGIALFGSRSSELRFESVVSVDQVPADPVGFYRAHFAMTFPTLYSEEELIELSPYIARQLPDPGDNVGDWTRKFLRSVERLGYSSCSLDFHRASIRISAIGGGKQKVFRNRTRHFSSAMAAAAILRCC